MSIPISSIYSQQLEDANLEIDSNNKNFIINNDIAQKLLNIFIITPTLGNQSSSNIIIEFGDYQCVHCANFNKYQKELLITYLDDTGIAKFMFKDFPINDLAWEKMSSLAAEASYCAAEQDKYWDYHDKIFLDFDSREKGKINSTVLNTYAEDIEIPNIEKFKNCLESGKYSYIVDENNMVAQQLGLMSTPTFVMISSDNPERIEIESHISNFTQLIDIIPDEWS